MALSGGTAAVTLQPGRKDGAAITTTPPSSPPPALAKDAFAAEAAASASACRNAAHAAVLFAAFSQPGLGVRVGVFEGWLMAAAPPSTPLSTPW